MTDLRQAQRILQRDFEIRGGVCRRKHGRAQVYDKTEEYDMRRRPQPDEPPPRLPPAPVGWSWHRFWRWLWRLG